VRAIAATLIAAALAVGAFFLFHHDGGGSGRGGQFVNHIGTVTSQAEIRDRLVRYADLPRGYPRGNLPRDVRAGSRVVGRLGGATIFTAPTHDGYWEMFSMGKRGWWGAGRPWRTVEAGHRDEAYFVGGGGLYDGAGFPAFVSGSTLVAPGAKLLVFYAAAPANGSTSSG
jgi:hypothetical protein